MKLKLIVASMSMLGLMTAPAFAHNTKGHEHPNYKGDALPSTLSTCPKVDAYQPLLDAMNQNVGRAKPTVDCNKPIQFAGGINFDYQMLGPLNNGFMGENNNRFALNDAYLNATGHINRWVDAFLEVSYSNINAIPEDAVLAGGPHGADVPKPGIYSEAYDTNTLTLQQGYIFVGNLEELPFFAKLGKQFLDYGRYTIHPITRSMTQVMTESLQTAAQASFISSWNGFDLHGSAFAFQNTLGQVDSNDIALGDIDGHQRTNYGGQIGFGRISDQLGFDVGVGYMYDMVGINDVAYAVSLFRSGDVNADGFYQKRVNALTAYATLNTGPFSFNGHYATALQHFNAGDLGAASTTATDGAKPWAFDVAAAFNFSYWEKSQSLYVGYQQSGDAVSLFIPENRWVAGYGVDVMKNTNLALEYTHDSDYSESDGGTGENSNRLAVRLGVKFG